MARTTRAPGREKPEPMPVSRDESTIAGERLAYPSSPSPEVSSFILSIAPGATTAWMTHPVQAYIYVLEGTLTVELEDGARLEFPAGRAFLQSRTKWHRGRNQGKTPVRFLAVFCGAREVPTVLHPPARRSGAASRGKGRA